MSHTYTATYTRIEAGYMGQVVEWPEVETEGKDLGECQRILRDALHKMALAYQQQNRELPPWNSLVEQVSVELSLVS